MAKFKLFGVEIDVSKDDQTNDDIELCMSNSPHAENQEREPVIPPQLRRMTGPRSEPVFLYEKKLNNSDAHKSQNRLFVLRRDGFNKLLTNDETRMLNDPTSKGLENVVGVDTRGRSYKLGLNVWSSLKMMVINADWFKMVNENEARSGDWVQIWGHRQTGQLCLMINFNKARGNF